MTPEQLKEAEFLSGILIERVMELLKIPEVMKEYQSKQTKEDAEKWIFTQALITLMYSHEERIEMYARKIGNTDLSLSMANGGIE